MTPAERKKLKEDREKLKGYRNRLMLLKDLVPNVNALWKDNSKIVKFFESGEAAKFESRLTIKPGKPMDKVRKPLKVVTELTTEKFRELKEKGTSDKLIREQYKLHTNQLIAWKKANGLDNLNLTRGTQKPKANTKVEAKDVAKATVDIKEVDASTVREIEQDYKERITALNLKNQQLEKNLIDSVENIADLEKTAEIALKSQKQALEELKESNLRIKGLEAELEKVNAYNNKKSEQLELAQKAERQAIDELIVFQADYRKLEVDYRNQSSEMDKLKKDIEYLKPYQHMSLEVMERYLTENKRFDAFVEAHKW